MTGISNFAFEDHLVRVVKQGDEPWFVGRDVCKVLQIKNETQAMSRLDSDERRDGVCITDPIGREQSVIVVSEPGVFRLVFSSRKPEAERFKRWLAHEVLPELRRTGSYALHGPAVNKIAAYLAIACLVLMSVDILIHKHVHFAFEDLAAFHGWIAFLGGGGLALLAAGVGRLLRRGEDYYRD